MTTDELVTSQLDSFGCNQVLYQSVCFIFGRGSSTTKREASTYLIRTAVKLTRTIAMHVSGGSDSLTLPRTSRRFLPIWELAGYRTTLEQHPEPSCKHVKTPQRRGERDGCDGDSTMETIFVKDG